MPRENLYADDRLAAFGDAVGNITARWTFLNQCLAKLLQTLRMLYGEYQRNAIHRLIRGGHKTLNLSLDELCPFGLRGNASLYGHQRLFGS
jgi:hypothetical protein